MNPWTAALQASLSFTVSWSLIKLMSVESAMPFYHLILCRSLFLLPSTFPSFRESKSALHIRWPKYWSFSFSISPFNEYSGLISFRIDWFDLIHSSVYMSIPISQFIPPPPLPLLLGLQMSFTQFLVTSRSLYLTLTFIQLPQRHFRVNLSEVECVFFPQSFSSSPHLVNDSTLHPVAKPYLGYHLKSSPLEYPIS